MNILAPLLFLATIPLANWLIGNVGTTCVPAGPCLIPVAPGLMAPSGVMLIGVALVLRDMVRERLGLRAVVVLIAAGSALAAVVAPPALVIASAVSFAISELADAAVYEPMRRRSLAAAVFTSSIVGAIVDSALFLMIAFGSLDYLAGQVVGKAWAAFGALAFLLARRRLRA